MEENKIPKTIYQNQSLCRKMKQDKIIYRLSVSDIQEIADQNLE